MKSTINTAARLRLAALLALGAFALHQLRYLIAYGDASSEQLALQGHAYMTDALPLLAALGLSALTATALRARLGPELRGGSMLRGALAYAGALVAIFSAQELLEGVLDSGHPAGAAAVFAHGGWIALPLAIGLGALVAIAVRALERVELVLAPRRPRRVLARPPRIIRRPGVRRDAKPLLSPLAFGLARRPPPARI